MKIERALVAVHYASWVSATAREAAQGKIAPDAKTQYTELVWAPFPLDEEDRPKPDGLKPEEQGLLYAQNYVIKKRPHSRDVLAIVGCEMLMFQERPILSKFILNAAVASDLGLSSDPLDPPPSPLLIHKP